MAQSAGIIEGDIRTDSIIPVGDNVLIRPHETPEYKGRIIVPDAYKAVFPVTGTIVALGGNLLDDEMRPLTIFKVGDRVIFSKYAGIELKFESDKRLMCMKSEDILCIIGASVSLVNEE